MAWNEPDDDDKKKEDGNDPWSGRGKREQGPPELDALLRNLQKKFGRLFGSKSSGPNGGSSIADKGNFFILGIIFLIILVIWALSGIFLVQPAEQGVVLRFGDYIETVNPGPHWIPRFIDSVYIVNVEKISNYRYSAEMLTKDENIVYAGVAVQYRIGNPENYLFNIVNPVDSLKLATASALRQVVGDTNLNAVLTTGRTLVAGEVTKKLNNVLKRYHAGLVITDVALQAAKAPEAVRDAFDDAIKAREDQQRYINQANAYREAVIANAVGQSKRKIAEAQAFEQQVILNAQGDVARFLALLEPYRIAPKVTRERLYLSTVEMMLSKSSKILVDTKKGNNVLFLPLNKLLSQVGTTSQIMEIDNTNGLSKNSDETQEKVTTQSTSPRYPSRRSRFDSRYLDRGATNENE